MMPRGLLDEPPEYMVFYAVCLGADCGWDDECNHLSAEDCATECPECGGEVEINQDWDNR